ncbi:TPA: hypothetical protein QB288_000177 [Pasteurella multocida]|nr:hypothetical protein [Pasteurella multocida]
MKHLLYIDITQVCGLGCGFCMYADKHTSAAIHFRLSDISRKNLIQLINSPDVKNISISGEGEPLNNIETFFEILSLSNGERNFEFITSGFIKSDKLERFYDKLQSKLHPKDKCNIRLSSDSHHVAAIKNKNHGFSINYFETQRPRNLTLSFRSIDCDKLFTQLYLMEEAEKYNFSCEMKRISILEDELYINNNKYKIDYKNLVYPKPEDMNYLSLKDYVIAIENKTNKPFTFGSLNKAPIETGIDLTIKPNGDVFLYGMEVSNLGNLHFDEFNWDIIASLIKKNKVFSFLYEHRLLDVLEKNKDDNQINQIIKQVNNPYWLIKEIHRKTGNLEEFLYRD